jgi:hypothetical protein
LKKRTSINSIPKVHKEKAMADFRRWLYAFAMVALLAGLTIPASAQTPLSCTNNSGAPVIVRQQGITEQVGDLVFTCTGGIPTTAGSPVQQVTFTVSLTAPVTSRLTSSSGFTEALLIVDEPNSSLNTNPILNCGAPGAPDGGVSGPGVCQILGVGPGVASQTYNGTAGHPNVFQAHQLSASQSNSLVWSSVPFDPPGTSTTRTLRFTNIRADAESLGISASLTAAQISAVVNVQPSTSVPITQPTVLVASVFNGVTVSSANQRLDFTQCITENGKLFGGTGFYFGQIGYGGVTGGGGNNLNGTASYYVTSTPTVRFTEGFDTAFKPKNVNYFLTNGGYTFGAWQYGLGQAGAAVGVGPLNTPGDFNQNVPGALYYSESGFEFNTAAAGTPNPNPPTPDGPPSLLSGTSGGTPLQDSTTGIAGAGVASQGTRLYLNFGNIPQGVNLYVPAYSYLQRAGGNYGGTATTPGNPTVYVSGTTTGVAILVTTDANGASSLAFSAPNISGSAPASAGVGLTGAAPLTAVSLTSGAGLAVYEVLFADPGTQESLDVPVVVAYTAQLNMNAPVGLPIPNQTGSVTGGFAPFYPGATAGSVSLATARPASSTLPIPRFTGGTPANLFLINKCACNLLFPFVANVAGYDTSIAIANTSQDPGGGTSGTNSYGFGSAQPQSGTVTLWYYGTPGGGSTTPIPPQTSSAVGPGQSLYYVLSSGNSTQGLDNRGAGFEGYIIAQAGFQYCHAYAFITALGATPTSVGVNTGYLGIVLDKGGLPRTAQIGENDAH